jgi:hypothetical protein
MWPDRIIVASPALDDDLGLTQGIEDLAIEQLITQPRIERFDIAVLPGTARLDIGRLGTDCGDPFLNRTRHELGSVVGTHVAGYAAQDEEIGQDIDHVDAFELTRDPDGQAFMGELVDNVEHPEAPPVMGALLEEVVGPHMIAMHGPQPDARAVRHPQSPAFGLPARNFEPLTPPDPLDPLGIDEPAGITQQRCNLAIAIAPVLTSELDDVGGQPLFVIPAPRRLALCRAMLSENRTGAALGDRQFSSDMLDAGAPARGAQ